MSQTEPFQGCAYIVWLPWQHSPSSSDVCNGAHTSQMLHEDHPGSAVVGGHWDIEPPVAVQQGRQITV